MTEQEKAEDLYQMYYECLWHQDEQSRIQNAKQCALIAVDEILKHEEYIINKIKYSFAINGISVITKALYWQQVRQEIEKL